MTTHFDVSPPSAADAIMPPPDRASAHAFLERGAKLQADGQLQEALAVYQEAIAADPGYAPIYNNLLIACLELGSAQDAAHMGAEAVTLDPGVAEYWSNLGRALQALGKIESALEAFEAALARDPDSLAALRRIADLLPVVGVVQDSNLVAGAMARAIGARSIDSDLVGRAAYWLVRQRHPQCFTPDTSADPTALAALAADTLFVAALGYGVGVDPEIEPTALALRRALLDLAPDGLAGRPELMALAVALALQSHFNEFAWAITTEEAAAADALAAELSEATTARAEALVLFALYRPLAGLDAAPALSARNWSGAADRLVEAGLRLPLDERARAAAMTALTPVDNEVSKAVRAQYEDNPYPRWNIVGQTNPMPFATVLRRRFPGAPEVDFADANMRVLVAGCGTGQQPVQFARRHPHAKIRAIDLSRASLAYAARMAEVAGVTNIDFAQADILGLGDALAADGEAGFDVILCTGVVHHMADPAAGLAALSALLRPGGYMFLAVYSERARASIVAARARVAELGLAADAEGVRALRTRVLAGDAPELAPLLDFSDFYSTSGCRDLVFHACEHRYTPAALGALVAGAGLDVVGCDLEAQARAAYRQIAPHDLACADLAAIEQLEAAEPTMFRSMIQLLCHKSG